jgi:pre-mRNA-splicing factor SYF1
MDIEKWIETISEEEIPFELQILENPENEENWNKYIDLANHELEHTKKDDKYNYIKILENLVSLYYRKFISLGKNFENWLEFINFYINVIKNNFDPIEQFDGLNRQFQKELETYGNSCEYWRIYMNVLFEFYKYKDFDFNIIDIIFNTCLMKLNYIDQIEIWKIMLINYKSEDKSKNFKFYSSFFIYLKNCHKFGINQDKLIDESIPTLDKTFNLILRNFTNENEIKTFENIFNILITPKFLLKSSYSELENYSKYFEKLIELAMKRNDNKSIFHNKISGLFKDVINKFPDQKSNFAIRHSKYLINIGKFDDAIDKLNIMLTTSTTVSDFTLIFNALAEILEDKITKISSENENNVSLIGYIEKLEKLLSDRLILLNDVKLRQNKNCPSTWIERLELFSDDDSKFDQLLECYSKAVISIDTKKIPNEEKDLLPQIWVDYAKIYYKMDNDLSNTRSLFETATKVPWTELSQLEYVWIEWLKLEIECDNIGHATFLSSKAISIPEKILNGKIDLDDENVSYQMKLFKSIRLWSLHLDLIENTKKFEDICKAYEEAMELKVINGIMVINYCLYLEENEYYEKSFSIFERGLNMFSGDSKSILYCIYLNKILTYWNHLNWNEERVREIFEQGLDYYKEEVKFNNLKQVYILYSEWEMKYGSKIRSLKILNEAINDLPSQNDKLTIYKILIVNTIESKGIESVIDVFRDALNVLSVQISGYISEIISGFVEVEITLGEVENARSILRYAAENVMEFNKSNEDRLAIWELFRAFELENGDESSYKNMLRLKRYLENIYGDVLKQARVTADNITFKDTIGFVTSTEGHKTSPNTIQVSSMAEENGNENENNINVDAIELDMDLDDDD